MNSVESAKKIIEQYIEYSNIEGQSKLNGDYKTGNKMSKKLNKLESYLKENNDLAKIVLKELLKSNSIRARSMAAVDSLRLNMYVEESLKVLKEIANNEEYGILGLGPEISLEIWKEKGRLEP
ncbi:hypothetical protein [Clostridium sp.]|uniref:hypothetical protein n=1 Tax=Clostridium sp. TaxID=1506 RepID=UPI003D6D5908